MTATAFDSENNIVLVDPSKIVWTIDNSTDFSITVSGILKSILRNTMFNSPQTTITATEKESGNNINGSAIAYTNLR